MPISWLTARRLSAAFLLALVISAPAPPSARQAPSAQQSQPVASFRTGVDLLVLDVSVLDSQRRPVRGLTADDFTVLEDGKPQKISSFSAIDLPDADLSVAPAVRDVAPDVQRNSEGADPRLVVIVMDDSTPMRAEEVLRVKNYGRRIIESLGPQDLAAVVYTFDQTHGQNYTRDRKLLRASVEKFGGGVILDKYDPKTDKIVRMDYSNFEPSANTMYAASIGTLQGVARDLAESPQRRKFLFFVSVGLPLSITSAGPRYDVSSGTTDSTGPAQDLIRRLEQMVTVAHQANVNIYGIDPGGLRSVVADSGNANMDYLRTLSERTGGFATVNTDDPAPGIAQAFRENGSFYLIGYQPSNPRMDRRFRRLEVRVNRPGMTVRTRDGYYEPETPKPGKTKVASPLITALAGVLPKTDIDMRVTAAAFRNPGRSDAAVAVSLRVTEPMPQRTTRREENLDVLVNAYDAEKGNLRGSEKMNARVMLRPGAAGDVEYDVVSRLDLKPGRYQLRVAATKPSSGKSGSVYCDVEVPDFWRAPVSLSGIVLTGGPATSRASQDKLGNLLPVAPVVTRDFARTDTASVFFRVYQGDKSPLTAQAVNVHVLDRSGRIVFNREEALSPARFSQQRTADCKISLPLSWFEPGPHVLVVEVGVDKSRLVRELPFRMQ